MSVLLPYKPFASKADMIRFCKANRIHNHTFAPTLCYCGVFSNGRPVLCHLLGSGFVRRATSWTNGKPDNLYFAAALHIAVIEIDNAAMLQVSGELLGSMQPPFCDMKQLLETLATTTSADTKDEGEDAHV